MQPAPIPKNEKQRLVSLYKLDLLDTPPEERFDQITRTATRIFQLPISTLTLVNSWREWFKSCQGLAQLEGNRTVSFCGHALLADDILVIPDTKKDNRFADNPMVTGKPYLRFYAGVPIISADGGRVGVFCIQDTKPREFSKDDEEILKGLASWAEIEVNSRNLSVALSRERKLQTEIKTKTQELELSSRLQAESKKALLNVMEDLEAASKLIELEKVKDDAMLASIGDGLIAVDNHRKIIMINKVAEDLLGWKANELIGQIITSLPLEDEQGTLIPLSRRPTTIALSEGKTTNTNYYFVRRDKTRFPISITATPIKLNKKTIGLIEIIRDITHETEVDKAKSEFVSLASHQLRTPLGIMKWYLEALEQEVYYKNAPQTIQNYFAEIYKSNERVLGLVRNLLSVSRIEQGRVKNIPKSVNLIEQVTEIVELMQIEAHNKNVALHLTIQDHKIPSINIDLLRLQEVIENLIANAIEYTPASGSVEVTVYKVDDRLFIRVKDTGIGISPVDQKKLFTKFFRSEKAVRHNPEGTGLGLYVVKSYVEGWGGKIVAESVEGKGSTFTISLPIS